MDETKSETKAETDTKKPWYITDWDDHYEVNSNGGPWKPDDTRRRGRLAWVRWHIYGPSGDNMVFAESAEIAERYGEWAWPVAVALFSKLVEVAGRQKGGGRG